MDASFLPVDKLLDDFHPGIQLVERQDVLLSKETQSRALSKILPRAQGHKTSRVDSKVLKKKIELFNIFICLV